jgi:transglutaminase-like putative cysteine protease
MISPLPTYQPDFDIRAPVTRVALNTRYADAVSILSILNGLAIQFARTPEVYQAAIAILGDAGNNNQAMQSAKLFQFVRTRMRYVADPLGGEMFTSPIILLKRINAQGFASGDCDDMVLLIVSLFRSVGIESMPVAVKINGADHFNHVVAAALIDGNERLFDATIKTGPTPPFGERLFPCAADVPP